MAQGGSREALEQALSAAREAGNAPEEARVLRELAAIDRAEGHDWRARRRLEKALEIYRETNDLRGVRAVLGELEPVAEAEGGPGEDEDPAVESHATDTGASDLITMRPTGPPGVPAPTGGRLSPTLAPGGSRREGTSWPVAVGFLVLLLAVAGTLVFFGVRFVGDLFGDEDTDTAQGDGVPIPATVEPSPATTRLPADGDGDRRPLVATPQSCDVTGSDVFAEVAMRVRLTASEPFQVVVLRGTLSARGGREIGSGITPVTPVRRGSQRVDMTFTVFEEIPDGRLTCGVEIQTAVPQL